MQFVQYREMEDLHRGDGAEEGSRLPIADERWLHGKKYSRTVALVVGKPHLFGLVWRLL